MQPQERFFAVTSPGLEDICRRELLAIGLENPHVVPGGVEFSGGLSELYRANLWLRSAARILLRCSDFAARDFPTLYRRLVRLPWGRFVKPESCCEVRATCRRSRLLHSGRVVKTTLDAIDKALGRLRPEGSVPQKIYVRIENDRCQVSIDSSGELLHRRGYRTANVAAPIRENLAAACLLALEYDGRLPLLDIMVGSGTFAIEAALIALGRAPGAQRRFAFMDWPKYRPGLWQQLLLQAEQQERGNLSAPIMAVDSNPQAIRAAEKNLQAAGLAGLVQLSCQQFQTLTPPADAGLLICNPPYGERLGKNAALPALYRDLGQLYGKMFASWQGAIVCPENELVRATGIPFGSRLQFANGGIGVSLLKKP